MAILHLLLFPMLIGLVVRIHDGLLPVIAYFLNLILLHGRLRNNLLSLVLVLWRSIGLLLTCLLRQFGSVIYCVILEFPYGPICIYCDNLSTTHLATNLVLHARTKDIELDHQFLREKVQSGDLISSDKQLAGIFTKTLSPSHFSLQRTNLRIRPMDA